MRTVVIPAAGTGSRLKEHTHDFNKAMCTLGEKPIISYIIEKFQKTDEIIILLGYKGDLLRQVVKACHPDYNITFVDIDLFEGEGSGLGYSLSKARHLLRKPFIFWSNDTLVDEKVEDFTYDDNWMLLSKFDRERANSYRHARIADGKVCSILPKEVYDENGVDTLPYVGVSFIRDYDKFWNVLDKNRQLFVKAGESAGLSNLDSIRYFVTSSWIDTGNKEILEKYKKIYNQRMKEVILEKPNEAIWFIGDRVVKFHLDEKFISDRVKRYSTILSEGQKDCGFVLPELTGYDRNVYIYKRAKGEIASSIGNPVELCDMASRFVVSAEPLAKDSEELRAIYNDFYRRKTLKRLDEYCTRYEELDEGVMINGLPCLSAKSLVSAVKWGEIAEKGLLTDNYHGDFHLENILYDKESGKWVLLDWRQNFGNSMHGDTFYDIAKMWHSLIVNHRMVRESRFRIKYVEKNEILIDIDRTYFDTEMEERLKAWLGSKGWLDQSELLTAIIFLNICACHEGEYNTFLFLLGKYLINKFFVSHREWFNTEELQ